MWDLPLPRVLHPSAVGNHEHKGRVLALSPLLPQGPGGSGHSRTGGFTSWHHTSSKPAVEVAEPSGFSSREHMQAHRTHIPLSLQQGTSPGTTSVLAGSWLLTGAEPCPAWERSIPRTRSSPCTWRIPRMGSIPRTGNSRMLFDSPDLLCPTLLAALCPGSGDRMISLAQAQTPGAAVGLQTRGRICPAERRAPICPRAHVCTRVGCQGGDRHPWVPQSLWHQLQSRSDESPARNAPCPHWHFWLCPQFLPIPAPQPLALSAWLLPQCHRVDTSPAGASGQMDASCQPQGDREARRADLRLFIGISLGSARAPRPRRAGAWSPIGTAMGLLCRDHPNGPRAPRALPPLCALHAPRPLHKTPLKKTTKPPAMQRSCHGLSPRQIPCDTGVQNEGGHQHHLHPGRAPLGFNPGFCWGCCAGPGTNEGRN